MKQLMEDVKEVFPFPFFQYGSRDSTDIDVIISISESEMPASQEERKKFVRQLMDKYNLNWNATLAVFNNGVMVDTIYTKAWVDSLNNAFLETYQNHKQLFPIPVNRKLERNYTLAIYKAVRTVLTFLTRTQYRKEIKPVLKGIHPFAKKLEVIGQIDFIEVTDFNQPNASNVDIWKIIAFYIGQNHALITKKLEIYSKAGLIEQFPELTPFVKREPISLENKKDLMRLKESWLKAINDFGSFTSHNNILTCGNERIDMKTERF